MQVVASNHADTLRRPGSDETPEGLLIDTVGGELRVLYDEAADDLPPALIALAMRLDGSGGERAAIA